MEMFEAMLLGVRVRLDDGNHHFFFSQPSRSRIAQAQTQCNHEQNCCSPGPQSEELGEKEPVSSSPVASQARAVSRDVGCHKSLPILPFPLPRSIPWQLEGVPGTLEGRPYLQRTSGWAALASSEGFHKKRKNKISKVRTSHWPARPTTLPQHLPMGPIGLFKQRVPDAASPRTVVLTLALQSCREGSTSPCSCLAHGAAF